MVSAYVLIETAPGTAGRVALAARELPWVKAANAVTGPYDVIAVVEAADLAEIGRDITGLQRIDGVLRTLTCLHADH